MNEIRKKYKEDDKFNENILSFCLNSSLELIAM